MQTAVIYVSITGLRLKRRSQWLRFWWHALRSLNQARKAPGNLKTEARMHKGVHHTLSVWTDEPAMRAFLTLGAHRKAMRAFRAIGTGRVLGFTASEPPDWETALRRWSSEAREV